MQDNTFSPVYTHSRDTRKHTKRFRVTETLSAPLVDCFLSTWDYHGDNGHKYLKASFDAALWPLSLLSVTTKVGYLWGVLWASKVVSIHWKNLARIHIFKLDDSSTWTHTHTQQTQTRVRWDEDHLHQPAGLLISVQMEQLINEEVETDQIHERQTQTHRECLCIIWSYASTKKTEVFFL